MSEIGRRDFLQVSGLSLGALAFKPGVHFSQQGFPEAEQLGRVCVGRVDIQTEPEAAAPIVTSLYEDSVVAWDHSVVGNHPYRINQTWAETPQGYIYAPYLQPVKNQLNKAVLDLKETSLGSGMWVEVTVPHVEIILANPPARAPWLKATDSPKLYYSQILWVDEIRQDDNGRVWYRVNERFGFGDIFWARAEAFRKLEPEDMAPINPGTGDKRVVIDLTEQTMSCFEGDREVYFCKVSTGAKFDAQGNAIDKWSTPIGGYQIWRKVVSLHMVGGTTGGGYDLPGIGWTTLFVGNGVAIHSTFWHNDFGVPRSHGCVNAKPADANWVFRWVEPVVAYDPGDVTIGMPGGTKIEVVET